MEWTDWITAGIAVYGAIVSSYLGYLELIKGKRKIKIILEYVAFEERYQITVINVGYRPITLTGIAIEVPVNGGPEYTAIPSTSLIENNPFPERLEDGKSLVMRVQSVAQSEIYEAILSDSKYKPKITLLDAEGNKFTKYETQDINPKWTTIEKEERHRSIG